MRLSIEKCAALALAVLTLLAVLGCGRTPLDGGPVSELGIVASIYPLGYFAERVAGERGVVTTLVQPGVEAHDFEPTAHDLQTLAAASVVIVNGVGLEPWLERALASSATDAAVVVANGADDANADPHVWLDPAQAELQVASIRDGLAAVDPDGAPGYAERASQLVAELRALHAEFDDTLSNCRLRTFITSHGAYGHLAARYGLTQVSLTGLSSEAEPSARRLREIADQARSIGARHILVEPVASDRLARTLASEVGLSLLPIHAIESVTDAEFEAHGDYFGLMRDNLRSLATALDCEGAA